MSRKIGSGFIKEGETAVHVRLKSDVHGAAALLIETNTAHKGKTVEMVLDEMLREELRLHIEAYQKIENAKQKALAHLVE